MMRRNILCGVVFLAVLNNSRLPAQEDACANPNSPRVGVFILSTAPLKSAAESYEIEKRRNDVEKRLQEALINQLFGNCIVRDTTVFSDPTNFPTLKGSLEIMISALPSFQDPKVAAIAVQLSAVQGAFAEQSFPMGFLPLLIEDESDYDLGAKTVLHFWRGMGASLEQNSHKK